MGKSLERQILEDELLEPPMVEVTDEVVPKPRKSFHFRKIHVRSGIAHAFDDANGCYDRMRGFYRELNRMMGNKNDPFA